MEKIHMIGIGGIGMSALAQLYAKEGNLVTGSDRSPSPAVEDMLLKKGIQVYVGEGPESVFENVNLVVYSDAIPEDNPERVRARELGIRELMYFEALGEVSKGKRTLAVSGTHGKTTTTGLLTKILVDAGKEPTAIVGSIMKDFSSNFVSGRDDLFVVEACEYRGHLLHFKPSILVVTNIEWDHTDYYPDLASMQKVFREAMESATEAVITNPSDPNIAPLLDDLSVPVIDYTKEEVSDTKLIGEFNKMNAEAAAATARFAFPELPSDSIKKSLQSFQGTWRRFENKGMTPEGALVFDDYAHHPTAVSKTLVAVREKFPDKHITVVFHPHLYSRTRDLMDEFATAFDAADNVIIAPIYAAREAPIEGVTNHALADKIRAHRGEAIALDSFDEIEVWLRKMLGPKELIITMGAGDIYKVGEKLTK